MIRKTSILIVLLGLLIIVFGVVGSTAYTSMTLDRQSNINVVADDSGIVQLNPGSVSFVDQVDGELTIDVTRGGASGVNVNSVLLMGNNNNPTQSYAFSVINNDDRERTMNFDYVLDNSTFTSSVVTFDMYDSSENSISSFSNQNSGSATLSSGEEVFVVMEVDTSEVNQGEDLSGTLSILSE